MIVAILLAYLDRIAKRRHFRDVFIGVGLAVVLAAGGGVAADYVIGSYDGSRVQTIFETITFWWRRDPHLHDLLDAPRTPARSRRTCRQRAERAMSRGERLGLGMLSFQAVGREGLETAVFTLRSCSPPSARRERLRRSPQESSPGRRSGCCRALPRLRDVPPREAHQPRPLFHRPRCGPHALCRRARRRHDREPATARLGHRRRPVLWNTSHQLSEGSNIGDLFHSLFGYADRPTVLQLVCYVAYLAVALGAFTLMTRRRRRSAPRRPAGIAQGRATASGSVSPRASAR